MPTLSLERKDLPFLLGGGGEVKVDTGDLRLNRPIAEGTPSLIRVAFNARGDDRIRLGQDDSVKVAVSTKATLGLTPLFSTSAASATKLLTACGVGHFFKNGSNSDKLVLCFDAATSGEIAVAGAFRYGALKPSTVLEAGTDAGFTYLRAFDKAGPLEDIVPAFFSTMRFPEQGKTAPESGEAIRLQYGGYLRLSAELAAGYELAGTKSFAIGQLALSEKYDLSIIGRIGLSAAIAGRFSILVTADDQPGWARVEVRRDRAEDMKIAADVDVGFRNALDLPSTAHEFLGAVLGVNAKNFLNVFRRVVGSADSTELGASIDGLVRVFIEQATGRGFDALARPGEFQRLLRIASVVLASQEEVEDRAVTLFDRYFDRLDQLIPFLDELQGLTGEALRTLRKDLNLERWTMLAQLTDGDPLGFLLGQVTGDGERIDSVTELKKRATAVLSLIRDSAHAEIRRVIGLARQHFSLDKLFGEMAGIDSVDELQALASQKVGLFVTRLVGRRLDSATNVKQAFSEIRAVLLKVDEFSDKLFKAFKEAANDSYSIALHAEYSRASETDSLVAVAINLTHERGAGLLAQAGTGDFEEILTIADPDVTRLREGVFTHHTRRRNAYKVNIVGWHANYEYEGFDRVITQTDQRLRPSDQGITVFTTTSLEVDRQRRRQDEEIHINFLLRALGESAGIVKGDGESLGYLIDALSSLTARYQLSFTDDDTSEMELRDYLAFAEDLGLDAKGATLKDMAPLLPRTAGGSFGKVETNYDIRFGQKALESLASAKVLSKAGEEAIRGALRRMVLSNYLKSDVMHDVAFSYASPAVFDVFRREGAAKFTGHSQRRFAVRLINAAIASPTSVFLDKMELIILATLYNIENALIDAIKDLCKLLNGSAISPAKFEKALGKFGDAMRIFDDFDQTTSRHGIGTNTVFAVFDMLVRVASGEASANTALLRLKSEAGGKSVEKLFLSDEAARTC